MSEGPSDAVLPLTDTSASEVPDLDDEDLADLRGLIEEGQHEVNALRERAKGYRSRAESADRRADALLVELRAKRLLLNQGQMALRLRELEEEVQVVSAALGRLMRGDGPA